DLIARRLHVKYDAAKLTTAAIADAVADTGMRAWLEHEEPVSAPEGEARLRQALVWTAGAALGLGLLLRAANAHAPSIVCFTVSLAAGLPLTLRRAATAMRVGSLDINVLMVIAAVGAVTLGQFSEAATVIFLFAVAQALESRTLEHARRAIRALMELTPTEALVRDAAGERKV